MAVSESLKKKVKAKLRITWNDDETDYRIFDEIVPTAEAAIRFKIGIPDNVSFDFDEPGIESMLFLAHCYYQWNDAEDEFDSNYAAEMRQARIKWEVWQHDKFEEETSNL